MPSNYLFLMEYHHLTGNEKALEAVTLTLDKMADGGIYDQLGGGFARYSTDADWLVPHFEKMLYDNAQLMSLYAQAFQLTKNPNYRVIVQEADAFLQREMTSPEGAFYSSLDADSEGEEGKFYVWTKAEIDSIFQDERLSAVFNDFYQITERGNWEHGKNILHKKALPTDVATKHKVTISEFNKLIKEGKSKLMAARDQRVRPGLDDKALTSWNALQLKGYVDAYQAFGDKKYLETALKNGQFLVENMMQEDGRLNRNYKDGKSVINAFLDDYAATIEAFVALYQVTFDEAWLDRAKKLTAYALTHFSDPDSPLLFYTSDIDPPLVTRKKETADDVISGSNSMMARNLLALGQYLYNPEWVERAEGMMHQLSKTILESKSPDFYSNWCQLYIDLVRPPYEVAIVGPEATDKRNALMKNYLPNALLLGGESEGNLELLKGKLQDGMTMIYVCRNKVCKLPVQEIGPALKLME